MNSIYQGKALIIPFAEIQHCERLVIRKTKDEVGPNGLNIITGKTTYNREWDGWENSAHVPEEEAEQFLKEWLAYRERVETPMMIIDPSLRTDTTPLQIRPLPQLVPMSKEARWRILNSIGTVVDEFTCKGGPLSHYAIKCGLPYSKVVEMGYRAEEVT